MRDWPSDPMRQHDRFIAAMCSDILETGIVSLDGPRARIVSEINRQVSKRGNR